MVPQHERHVNVDCIGDQPIAFTLWDVRHLRAVCSAAVTPFSAFAVTQTSELLLHQYVMLGLQGISNLAQAPSALQALAL